MNNSSWLTPFAWLIVGLIVLYLGANIILRPNAVKNWFGIGKDETPTRTAEEEIARAGLRVDADKLLQLMANVRADRSQLERDISKLRPAITPLLADPRVAKSRYPGLWSKATTSTVSASDLARFDATFEQLQRILDQPDAPGLSADFVRQATQRRDNVEKDVQSRREALDEIRAAFTKKK